MAESVPELNARNENEPSKLRLCFIADARSIHTVRWIRFFAERGHRVALVSANVPGDDLRIDLHCPLSPSSPIRGTRIARNVLELRNFLRKFRPHVLHAHYINEAGWLGALSRFHPFVLTAWGSDVYIAPRVSRLARILTPWTVRKADYVTADSRDQVESLRRMGASVHRTAVVGWGIDFAEFSGRSGKSWRRRYGIGEDQVVILSPRQWITNSNVSLILEAFAQVRGQRPNVILILTNRGDTAPVARQHIETAIRTLGIADATVIVRDVPETELSELYAASDVTVSVCSSDGTPVSLLEAMASRSVVVAGDLASIREWVSDGHTGVLVTVGDVKGLAAQLVRLVDDPKLRQRLSEAAYGSVRDSADRSRHLGGMEQTYFKLAEAWAARSG